MAEGKLYCEHCGEDIHIVPDFEPELEQTIQDILDEMHEDMTGGAAKKPEEPERPKEEDSQPEPVRKKKIWPRVLLVLLFLCILHGPLPGRRNELLLICALLSWGAFFLSPHYPDRASFGTMMLCICVIISLAKKILSKNADLIWPLWGGAVFIWLRGMYFCAEHLAITWGWIR